MRRGKGEEEAWCEEAWCEEAVTKGHGRKKDMRRGKGEEEAGMRQRKEEKKRQE
jgi:hypothetical protein